MCSTLAGTECQSQLLFSVSFQILCQQELSITEFNSLMDSDVADAASYAVIFPKLCHFYCQVLLHDIQDMSERRYSKCSGSSALLSQLGP